MFSFLCSTLHNVNHCVSLYHFPLVIALSVLLRVTASVDPFEIIKRFSQEYFKWLSTVYGVQTIYSHILLFTLSNSACLWWVLCYPRTAPVCDGFCVTHEQHLFVMGFVLPTNSTCLWWVLCYPRTAPVCDGFCVTQQHLFVMGFVLPTNSTCLWWVLCYPRTAPVCDGFCVTQSFIFCVVLFGL